MVGQAPRVVLGSVAEDRQEGSELPSVTYAQAGVEVALAWGWIDGQKDKLDDAWWLQRFCARRPKSIWSKISRDKAIALIDTGEDEALRGSLRSRGAKKWGRVAGRL